MKRYMVLALLLILQYSCSRGGDDRLKEQEKIRTQEQISGDNENKQAWAEKLEEDLNERKYFIEAVEGSYSGIVEIGEVEFNVRVSIVSNIPILYFDRTRTLDEINHEISNLAVNLNLKIENPSVEYSAVSCSVEDFLPDFKNGRMNIISESCKNIFDLFLSDSISENEKFGRDEKAKDLAKKISNGDLVQADYLSGFLQTGVSIENYQFILERE